MYWLSITTQHVILDGCLKYQQVYLTDINFQTQKPNMYSQESRASTGKRFGFCVPPPLLLCPSKPTKSGAKGSLNCDQEGAKPSGGNARFSLDSATAHLIFGSDVTLSSDACGAASSTCMNPCIGDCSYQLFLLLLVLFLG